MRPTAGGVGLGPGAVTMELAKVCPTCGTRYDAAAAFCQKDGGILRLTDEEKDARIGQVLLDQFRIEERIGQGGMGAVYRARQTTLGRDVAIKILHPDLAQNPDAVRRFHREARISTALDHPNVVRVFLFGQLPDGSLYLVMELLRGRTLADLLRVEPRLAIARALHIAIQICQGVGEAHAQGVVHRDVKPENIILVSKGKDPDFIKVLDFGIARLFRAEDQTQATQSGLVFGTARYISPEGAAGEKTDARSDVYSIGVLTYQLLCGDTPFPPSQPITLLMQHIHDRPPPLKSQPGAAEVPDAIADIVMRTLQKSLEGRYEDASDLAEALRLAADRAGIDLRPRAGATGQHANDSDRRDPSLPVRRDGSASVRRDGATADAAASGAGRDVAASSAGRDASRPRIAVPSTDDISLAGLPSARRAGSRSPWLAAAAFIFGAAAVGGLAFVVQALRGPSDDEARAALLARGETALTGLRYDGPTEDDVRSVTDALLAARADDEGALSLRRRAADALVADGGAEVSAGHRDVARERFELARTLVHGHEAATAAIAELDRPVAAPRVAGVRTDPAPVAGTAVTLTAVTPDGTTSTASDRPHFEVRRDGRHIGRRIDATADDEPGTFTASYTFPSAGTYVLEFHASDATDCFRVSTEIEVAHGARAPGSEGGDGPVTTMGSAPPTTGPTVVDVPPPVITPTGTTSPPPWTSTSSGSSSGSGGGSASGASGGSSSGAGASSGGTSSGSGASSGGTSSGGTSSGGTNSGGSSGTARPTLPEAWTSGGH